MIRSLGLCEISWSENDRVGISYTGEAFFGKTFAPNDRMLCQ